MTFLQAQIIPNLAGERHMTKTPADEAYLIHGTIADLVRYTSPANTKTATQNATPPTP